MNYLCHIFHTPGVPSIFYLIYKKCALQHFQITIRRSLEIRIISLIVASMLQIKLNHDRFERSPMTCYGRPVSLNVDYTSIVISRWKLQISMRPGIRESTNCEILLRSFVTNFCRSYKKNESFAIPIIYSEEFHSTTLRN